MCDFDLCSGMVVLVCLKKNTTKRISDREQVLDGWPLLEVIWMYVLLKQIYLTYTLHIICFVF